MHTLTRFFVKNLLAATASLFICSQAMAGIAVIVSTDSGITQLSDSEIKAIYLGKSKILKPIDQLEGSAIRIEFMEKVIGKSENQFGSYWAKRVFGGKGLPPKVLNSNAAVIKLVAGSKAIGYIDDSAVNGSVRVIYKVQ